VSIISGTSHRAALSSSASIPLRVFRRANIRTVTGFGSSQGSRLSDTVRLRAVSWRLIKNEVPELVPARQLVARPGPITAGSHRLRSRTTMTKRSETLRSRHRRSQDGFVDPLVVPNSANAPPPSSASTPTTIGTRATSSPLLAR